MPVRSILHKSFSHSFLLFKYVDYMGSQSVLQCLTAIYSPRLTFRVIFHTLAESDHIYINLNRTCIDGVIIILIPAAHLSSLPS